MSTVPAVVATLRSRLKQVQEDVQFVHHVLINTTSSIESNANRHHVVNARLSANRAKKAMAAAISDMENALRLLEASTTQPSKE